MNEERKDKPPQKKEPALTFEEAMRAILHTPKEKVDRAMEKEKKKPRGNSIKNNKPE